MKRDAFERLYLWAFESKGIGGIYFLGFVAIYMFLGVIAIGTSVGIGFWQAVQMLAACALIGFGQNAILPREKLDLGRCLIWGAFSAGVTVGFTAGFKWFDGFPLWCGITFCVIMTIGYMMLWPAFYWQSKRETQKLNEKLKVFQSKKEASQ